MTSSIKASEVKTIIIACEAGIGSSIMSVNALKKKLKAANINNVNVVHSATINIPANAQLIIAIMGSKNLSRRKLLMLWS